MAYSYSTQRQQVFTETGTRMLLEIRDLARAALRTTGAVQMSRLFVSGDSWDSLACVDYMLEREELREITGPEVAGQDRVFVCGRRWSSASVESVDERLAKIASAYLCGPKETP